MRSSMFEFWRRRKDFHFWCNSENLARERVNHDTRAKLIYGGVEDTAKATYVTNLRGSNTNSLCTSLADAEPTRYLLAMLACLLAVHHTSAESRAILAISATDTRHLAKQDPSHTAAVPHRAASHSPLRGGWVQQQHHHRLSDITTQEQY